MSDPTQQASSLGGIPTTPGTFPGATGVVPSGPASPLGGAPGAPPDAMAQLLKMIIAGAQQRPQIHGATSPAPIPPGAPPQQTLVGKHAGAANLGNFIGSTIQNAVHMDRQKKLQAAVSDWNDLLTSTQKYMKPDGTVDDAAYRDPAVMQILGDPKKLKLMAKSLNADWLNPRPDLYADARQIALKQHSDKQGALQGLKSVFASMNQRIRGQGQQQPQMTDQQRQAMAKDVMSRAPVAMGATSGPDVKGINETMRTIIEQNKAKEDAAYHQASLAATVQEKEAALAQAKQISEQNFMLREMQLEYQRGVENERIRHDKAMEGIARDRTNKASTPKISAAEQDKRDKLSGATASVGQIVSKYKDRKDEEKIDADDQQLLSGMFNVVSGARMPKKARTWTEELFSSGNVMTVGQAKKMQKLLQNFKVSPSAPEKTEDGISFTPDDSE